MHFASHIAAPLPGCAQDHLTGSPMGGLTFRILELGRQAIPWDYPNVSTLLRAITIRKTVHSTARRLPENTFATDGVLSVLSGRSDQDAMQNGEQKPTASLDLDLLQDELVPVDLFFETYVSELERRSKRQAEGEWAGKGRALFSPCPHPKELLHLRSPSKCGFCWALPPSPERVGHSHDSTSEK